MTTLMGETKGLPSTFFGMPAQALLGWAFAALIAFGALVARLGILESRVDPRVDVLISQRADDRKEIEALKSTNAAILQQVQALLIESAKNTAILQRMEARQRRQD